MSPIAQVWVKLILVNPLPSRIPMTTSPRRLLLLTMLLMFRQPPSPSPYQTVMHWTRPNLDYRKKPKMEKALWMLLDAQYRSKSCLSRTHSSSSVLFASSV